jgi:large subunit ribosomal protein L1
MDAITKAKPSGIKGTYMRKVSICSTMGPGIRLDLSSLSAA